MLLKLKNYAWQIHEGLLMNIISIMFDIHSYWAIYVYIHVNIFLDKDPWFIYKMKVMSEQYQT